MQIPPLTQLQAYADFEAKNRPDPLRRQHITQWAVEEIERLMEEVAELKQKLAQASSPF